MEQEHANEEPSAYKERKASATAIRKAHKLNEDFSNENKANRRIALIGFVALLAILGCFYVYGELFKEPLESTFQFDVKVIDLVVDSTSGKYKPSEKRIKVSSEQLGQVEAMVPNEIYEGLKVGDEIKISPTNREENGHFKVIENSNQRAP